MSQASSIESQPSKRCLDLGWTNTLLLSIGFGLCFFGCNAFMNFAVPILGNLGSICMAIVNYVNAFSNFLVPSTISFFGNPRQALFWCGFSYLFYISLFSYILPPVQYTMCAIHGFLSAVVWASQGIILGDNATDKDRGTKSGFFLAVYMFGSAFGNIASGYLVKKLGISNHVEPGWNGNVSILFLFLGCSAVTAVIPYALIKPASSQDIPEKSINSPMITAEEGQVTNMTSSPKPSVLQEIINVLKLAFTSDMVLLLCFFLNLGYQQVFLTSQFTRQLVDLSSVGTLMAIFSITDVIACNIQGSLCDRFGHTCVLSIAITAELVGLSLTWIANSKQNWIVYVTGIVFAFADGGFQTECLAIVNQYFEKDRTTANAVFRMFQCFGFGIALTLTPMFISAGQAHSSPMQFFWEIVCAASLGVIGYIGCLFFLCKQKSRN